MNREGNGRGLGGPARKTLPTGDGTNSRQSTGPEPARHEAPADETLSFLRDCQRRREEAALRLPPLPSGHRDPLGPRTDAPDRGCRGGAA